MPTKTKKPGKGKGKENDLVLTRVFDAPRERVWKAWTDPEEVKRWWGPKGFTAPVIKNDLRVGGKYLYCMRGPDGKDYWSTGVYREIVPMEKIVATDSFADEKGNVVPATHYGMGGDLPLEMLVTLTFEDLGGWTRLTLRHAGFPAGTHRGMAEQGWGESLDKLGASLTPGYAATEIATDRPKRRIVMSRVFDAPRSRVWRAYTDPDLIPKWWGLRSHTTRVEAMEVKMGGRWRYVSRDADGKEFAFRGEIRDFVPPELLAVTFEFEGMPGHVIQDTARFEDLGGKTRLTITSQFDSIEDLEGMVQSGMEVGARESWDRLAELLAGA